VRGGDGGQVGRAQRVRYLGDQIEVGDAGVVVAEHRGADHVQADNQAGCRVVQPDQVRGGVFPSGFVDHRTQGSRIVGVGR
jgi:hypothetical protein